LIDAFLIFEEFVGEMEFLRGRIWNRAGVIDGNLIYDSYLICQHLFIVG
jgi:hypothetical protein